LFIIDIDSREIVVRFSNKEHYDLIMNVAKRELFKEFGHSVKFSHFNLRADPLTVIKSEKTNSENKEENKAKNRKLANKKSFNDQNSDDEYKNNKQLDIIDKINDFIDDDTDILFQKLDEIREDDENYLDNTLYSSTF